MWTTPVIDRTLEDVQYAKEQQGKPELNKGAQNYTDWNRLVGNIYHIASVMGNYGFSVPLNSKAIWAIGDIPQVHEIKQIRTDLQTLRYYLYGFFGYTALEWNALSRTAAELDAEGRTAENYFSKQQIPDLPYTHYVKINHLEQLALDLWQVIDNIKGRYHIAGTYYAGQQSTLPRFIETYDDFLTSLEFDMLDRTAAQIDAENRTAADYFRRY